jgi:CheY-like chemotaxis protein
VRLQWSRIDGVECVVAVDMDISEKKQFQREIIAAREKAEQANRAKSAFLSSMSHEIRTPMNAILGYAQILDRDKNLNPNQRRKLGGIQKAGRHLLNLINDILDFSKIEAGKMELHPHDFSLSAMINDLYAIFRVRCDEKGVHLEMHHQFGAGNQWVSGDEGKLRQVLINLLDNALKYTDEGKIVFRITQKQNDVYKFDIQDTGIGISLEKQKCIFQYFEQDRGGHERGGTGLGLTISQKLVQMMGGQLKMESKPGHGSCFYFDVPLMPAQEKASGSHEDYRNVIGLSLNCKVRALVVDDNQANVEVLYEMLNEIGVEVTQAFSGKEAIEKAGQCNPDIIFMDYKMPGINGLEAAKAIQHENRESKIVMVTALSYQHQRAKFDQEGIDGFIGKPFLREEILKTLQTVLHVKFEYVLEEVQPEDLPLDVFNPKSDFSGVRIPNFLLLNLKKMAKLGMIAEVEKQLVEVEKIKPEGPRLASHLKVLAQNYDKEGILKALDNVEHG